jgi:hypothetical protein
MSRFQGTWLQLREPVDAASRAPRLVENLRGIMPNRPICVTDLGTGTGANLRYLAPILEGVQEWCLIDHDPALLAEVPVRISTWARARGALVRKVGAGLRISGPDFDCRVRYAREDLAAGLERIDLPVRSLVCASALLDLVSDTWLQTLARRCANAHASVLLTLNYDGRMEFDPSEPEDASVTELVNRHQLSDKGFGRALGPGAGPRALQVFEGLGYCIEGARSDWQLGPHDGPLQEALLEGWVAAASEIAPAQAAELRSWADRRRAHVRRRRSRLNVGHIDMLAWSPPLSGSAVTRSG